MAETPRVTSVMVDCADPEAMIAFWGALLDLEVAARYPDYVFMSRVNGDGPNLGFQVVPEPKTCKNRVHLDLASPDRESVVERIVELGGKRLADHSIEEFHWTTCADVEGNEFDVADAE